MSAAGLLSVDDLHVYYDSAHILQGVSFEHRGGVMALLGRNGMGKTTLAKTLMGLVPVHRGEVRFRGHMLTRRAPYVIAQQGIGYVPQGREVFASLTVDEHLKMLAAPKHPDSWSVAMVYELFPRLGERQRQYAKTLSGGEQQMLAIGRALMTNPALLIMDEPSEGLAPVVVDLLIDKLRALADSGVSILLIEQNIHVACELSEQTLILVSGCIERRVATAELRDDARLQERLLGVQTAPAGERDAPA